MMLWALRKGERVAIHYVSFGQLRAIVKHAKKWNVVLERDKETVKRP